MGVFIVIEGPDGSGKSTIVRLLVERLTAEGHRAIATRQPSDGPIGSLIRRALAKEEHLAREAMGALYAADRIDHSLRSIAPAVADGSIVVCDRYQLSNLVYRAAETEGPFYTCSTCGWHGEPVDCDGRRCPMCRWSPVVLRQEVRDRVTWASGLDRGVRVPDLTLALAVSPTVAAARRSARKRAAELYETDHLQARCCALYARAEELLPGQRVRAIDANGSIDAAFAHVWTAAKGEIERRST